MIIGFGYGFKKERGESIPTLMPELSSGKFSWLCGVG
jgi:hypothetical protein